MSNDSGGYQTHHAYSEFSYEKRIFTIAMNINGCFKDGLKPTSDDLARFIRDDIVFDLETIAGMEFNDLIPTVFLKFFDEQATEAFLSVIKNGVVWNEFGGRTVRGWRCDGSVLEVRVRYALCLTEDALRRLMSVYGEILHFEWTYHNTELVKNRIRDGNAILRIKKKKDCPGFLPNFLRLKETEDLPATVIKIEHRGQPRAGCYSCDDRGHFKRDCPRNPGFGRQAARNRTYANAIRFGQSSREEVPSNIPAIVQDTVDGAIAVVDRNIPNDEQAQEERRAAIQTEEDFINIERNSNAEGNRLLDNAWKRKKEAEQKKLAEAVKAKAAADKVVAAALEKKKVEALAKKKAVADAKEAVAKKKATEAAAEAAKLAAEAKEKAEAAAKRVIAENLRKAKAEAEARKAEEAKDLEAQALKVAEAVLEDITPSATNAMNEFMDVIEEEDKGGKRGNEWIDEIEGLEEGSAKEPRISADLISENLFNTSVDSVSLLGPFPRKPLFNRGEEKKDNLSLSAVESPADVAVASVASAAAATASRFDGIKKKNVSKDIVQQRMELQKKAVKVIKK